MIESKIVYWFECLLGQIVRYNISKPIKGIAIPVVGAWFSSNKELDIMHVLNLLALSFWSMTLPITTPPPSYDQYSF